MIDPVILCQSPIFRGISSEELKLIFEQVHFQLKNYEKNEMITFAGEICDRLLIVQRGSVKAEMNDYSGKTINSQ